VTLSDDRVRSLFTAHREDVTSVLRRLGIAAVEVDDLVQNVFVVAQRRGASLPKHAEGAKRWILDVARKHAANWHRLYRHRYEVLGLHDVITRAAAEPIDPEAFLALREVVWRALEKLDDDERRVLVGHHLGGETMAELGDLLGLTRSGAHARLQAAEGRFRELVRRYA